MFCSSQSPEGTSGNGHDDNGDGHDKKDEGPDVVIEDQSGVKVDPSQGALAQVLVPDVFPEVPILPVHRNPVFPRFVKMMEVCKRKSYFYKHDNNKMINSQFPNCMLIFKDYNNVTIITIELVFYWFMPHPNSRKIYD